MALYSFELILYVALRLKIDTVIMSRDIEKENLYQGVKMLVDSEGSHVHLCQPKLFTLFSIAFQYLLFKSTQEHGHYIIRIEDNNLAQKLSRKAKDESTRKFLSRLLLPRRLRYQNSYFHLDFFPISSWNYTSALPQEKVKAALIVKNTSDKPLFDEVPEDEEEQAFEIELPEHHYLTTLKDFVPKTVTIAFDQEIEGLETIRFPFVSDKDESTVSGVRIASDLNISDWD